MLSMPLGIWPFMVTNHTDLMALSYADRTAWHIYTSYKAKLH
jgi:hypothetical protein